MLYVTVRKT